MKHIRRAAALLLVCALLTGLLAGCGQASKETMDGKMILQILFTGPNGAITANLDALRDPASHDGAAEAVSEAWSGIDALCEEGGFPEVRDVMLRIHTRLAESGCTLELVGADFTLINTDQRLYRVSAKVEVKQDGKKLHNGSLELIGSMTFGANARVSGFSLEDETVLTDLIP